MNFNLSSPAQIFSGPLTFTVDFVQTNLQNLFCIKKVDEKGCRSCAKCLQITKNSHPNVLWLKTEKSYTLEDIEIVFEKTVYALDKDEKYFIIFEDADTLNLACSNKLLKTIEEPKSGYYFFFLTQRKDQILPTILSRCLVTNFYNDTSQNEYNDFIEFFTKSTNPNLFLKSLEKQNISEIETPYVLDNIISYWSKQLKSPSDKERYNKILTILNILTDSLRSLPMPGSSKIFWKNLYIKLNSL